LRKTRVIVLLVSVCILMVALAVPLFAADVQSLIDEFISDPAAGVDKMVELAKEDPATVALVLAGVAERADEIKVTDPTLANLLENDITLVVLTLMSTDPHSAAVIINTVKERIPEIGERIESIVVASGLEESYLRAASPVRP